MSASLPEDILGFLRKEGLAAPGEKPRATALAGGVSSDIWRVELASGVICVKRALPRLRVAQTWEAPVERNRHEHLWLEVANGIVRDTAPQVLAADDEAGCFAMPDLGRFPLWKSELAAGRTDPAFAGEVGRRLSMIHHATFERADLAYLFKTDAAFHALRLEPYLVSTGRVHKALEKELKKLVERTANTKLVLVHGDVSPKNILVGARGPIFLDAECAWYGDPAFDLAFCLNHLLLKCAWVPQHTAGFLACYKALGQGYFLNVEWEDRAGLEERAASLLPGLMLARLDGKSPVEYLKSDADKKRVRDFATRFLKQPPATLAQLGDAWQKS